MDAVPCSTPVAHVSKNRKKVRSFPVVLDHSEEALEKNALAEDSLVPIRLDMEFEGKFFFNSLKHIFYIFTLIKQYDLNYDLYLIEKKTKLMIHLIGHKLRDSFTWNRNEQCLSPAEFARILCDDLELPPNHFVAPITESIESQLRFEL